MRIRALALGAAVLAASACQTLPPAGVPLAEGDLRAAALLQSLDALGQERNAIRASARVSLSGQRGSSFARQLLLVERPARLRVEVLGLVGQRVAVLATDGHHYDLYRAETRAVEQGDIHPGILFEVAGVPLTPKEAVTLLLGGPAGAADATPPSAAHALPDGGVRLLWESQAGGDSLLEFDAEGRLRRYVVGPEQGLPLLAVAYDDYRPVGGGAFAHHVDFDFPRSDARAQVEFRSIELNPELPDELFRLPAVGADGGS